MATPLLCLLPWQKWIFLPHSLLHNFSWLLELYVSWRKITEASLLWSCLKIARLFRELFMPPTLSVIKLNLCITNLNCLWKRPACDKRLPLRILKLQKDNNNNTKQHIETVYSEFTSSKEFTSVRGSKNLELATDVQFRRVHTMFASPCARLWSVVWKPHNY